MKRGMRVVVDANVLVSAVLFKSNTPRKTLSYIMRFCVPVLSQELLQEYRFVLGRSALDTYTSRAKRIVLLDAYERGADIVRISGSLRVCRDPRDDMVVETALLGRADALVTGDDDILVLPPLDDVMVMRPAEFVKKYIQ